MGYLQAFKLDKNAVLPNRNHSTDAGADLFALEDVFIPVGSTAKIRTGIALKIENKYVGKIEGRSSMNAKGIITAGGVVDAGYSGELSVILHNFSNREVSPNHTNLVGYQVKAGEKIAQILVYQVDTPPVYEVRELWNSDRGSKGFGSSGR